MPSSLVTALFPPEVAAKFRALAGRQMRRGVWASFTRVARESAEAFHVFLPDGDAAAYVFTRRQNGTYAVLDRSGQVLWQGASEDEALTALESAAAGLRGRS
jgi:hypothetical protein